MKEKKGGITKEENKKSKKTRTTERTEGHRIRKGEAKVKR